MLDQADRKLRKRWLVRLVGVLLFAVLLFLSLRTNWQRPEWNFDMVGYVAVIESYHSDEPAEVHKRTYQALKEGVPKGEYKKLAGSSGYRKALSKRPDALMTQVPLYRNKPLYLAAVAGVHAAGANVARATFIVSLIAYAALALIVLAWMSRFLSPIWAGAMSMCIMLSHPVFLAARMSAPDMLLALVLVPAFLLMLHERWRTGLALLVRSISVPIRSCLPGFCVVRLCCGRPRPVAVAPSWLREALAWPATSW